MRNSIRTLVLAVTLAAGPPALADSAIVDAARIGDMDTVLSLLKEGADPRQAGSDGATALVWAAYHDDHAAVKALLEAGADPAAENHYGVSALSQAAVNGNPAVLRVLLEAGLSPDRFQRDGETALMTAARTGKREAVDLLLSHGADVNAVEAWRGQSALMWAAAEDHAEVVALLIERGADVNAVSRVFDYTDLEVKPGSVAMNFPRGGFTPLLFAARNGSLASARLLLDAGADIDLTDPDSTSPLLMSIINFHYDLAMELLERGADANIPDARGRAPLYAAVDMRRLDTSNRPVPKQVDEHEPLDVIHALLARDGLDIDAPLSDVLRPRAVLDGTDRVMGEGATAFMRAARGGDEEVMRLLLDAGADPHKVTADGTTALMIAAGKGWRDGKSNNTLEGTLAAVEVCLEAGVDLLARDDKGATALHAAATRGADRAIEVLASHGADLLAEDEEGNTPLDAAASIGGKVTPLHSTVALLESLMAQ